MSLSGIYCFEAISGNPKKIGWKYIGQSIRLSNRQKQHLSLLASNRHHSLKLQRYYNKYGPQSLKFYILEECGDNELNTLEIKLIHKFNSIKQGFNCTKGGKNVSESIKKPCLFKNIITGEEYRAESLIDFAVKYGFNPNAVSHIYTGKQNYLFDWYCPEQTTWRPIYYKTISPKGEEYTVVSGRIYEFVKKHNLGCGDGFYGMLIGKYESHKGWHRPDSILDNKGDKNFKLVNKDGIIFEGKNLSEFARQHKLNYHTLYNLYDGNMIQYNGWRIYKEGMELKYNDIQCRLISPEGKIYDVRNMEKFSKEHNLCRISVGRVKLGKQKNCKGWKLYEEKEVYVS